MALISLKCLSCDGDVNLDNNREFGFCVYCGTKIMIERNNYGPHGKSAEQLCEDGKRMLELGNAGQANEKFNEAIKADPKCWEAWLGYAQTGGDRDYYLGCVPAYISAYNLAKEEQQEILTFRSMVLHLPDSGLSEAFLKAYINASMESRHKMFELVNNVIGGDESEMATLAVDLCPNDWRAWFAKAKFRQVRVKWCEKRLDANATEVLNLFLTAYRLAKDESEDAKNIILSHIETMEQDSTYRNFTNELKYKIKRDGKKFFQF